MTVQTKLLLNKIASDFENAFFKRYPETAMYWGKTDVDQDRFMDHSIAALITWQKVEDDFLNRLKQLNVNELKGSSEYITYELLKETLESQLAARICHDELWHINPLWGWQNILSAVAEKQPIGSEHQREQALKRWATVGTVVHDEIQNLKLGLLQGYSAPKPVVRRVLEQLKIIVNLPTENSPFFEFAKRDGDESFKQKVAMLVENTINPAIKQYAFFLENEYLPLARDKIGVSALPGGIACYQVKIRKETTLQATPEEIYEYGLSHMQQLMREVATIGQRQFGVQAMREVFQKAKQDKQYLFQSEEEILNYNQAALERAKAKVMGWFDMMPMSPGILKPYPLHRAKTGSAGEYHPPSDDGARPGIFYINTYEPFKISRVTQEATLFHELIPGHHFQVALAHENTTQHSLNKYLWNSGYGEGWALYVERLADEMGLYLDDISRLGMLSNEALRTARLVVDPGIHAMNWTREEAIDYLKNHTALEDNIIESEVDRYIIMPGQATSYMLGKREIEMLREEAKRSLGENFDIRQFHNQILKNGSVTLPLLKDQVNSWLLHLKGSKASSN